MLETIREFAAERLEGLPDASELRDRHAAWFVALGERARPELEARRGPEWLDRLAAEHANLRASLEHLLACEDEGPSAAARRVRSGCTGLNGGTGPRAGAS